MACEGTRICIESSALFRVFRDALMKAKKDDTIDMKTYLKLMKYDEMHLWGMCVKGLFRELTGNEKNKLYFCMSCTNKTVSSYVDLIKSNVLLIFMTNSMIELEINNMAVLASYKCFEITPCKDTSGKTSIYFKWSLSRRPDVQGVLFKI